MRSAAGSHALLPGAWDEGKRDAALRDLLDGLLAGPDGGSVDEVRDWGEDGLAAIAGDARLARISWDGFRVGMEALIR